MIDKGEKGPGAHIFKDFICRFGEKASFDQESEGNMKV